MLVLARRENESIIIDTKGGERIILTYLGKSQRNDKMAGIGIDAPASCVIARQELTKA